MSSIKMKEFAICLVALFAGAAARSVIDDVDNNKPNFNDRIIGGENTTIEQHPYHIILDAGGGSIISPIRALTAAHCLDEDIEASRYSIVAGRTVKRGVDGQKRYLSRFVRHERFNTPFLANDIAIVFWEEPLTFGANVQAIRLPPANAPVPYGQNATLTGYTWNGEAGNHILQTITKALISNEECNRTMPGWIKPEMLCAEGVVGLGACRDDHGGPLVHNNTLIGIYSWYRDSCASGAPEVYTRVASFIDWIDLNSK